MKSLTSLFECSVLGLSCVHTSGEYIGKGCLTMWYDMVNHVWSLRSSNLFVCMILSLLEEQTICVDVLNFEIRRIFYYTLVTTWRNAYIYKLISCELQFATSMCVCVNEREREITLKSSKTKLWDVYPIIEKNKKHI